MTHKFAFALGDFHYKIGDNGVSLFNVAGRVIARRNILRPFPYTEYDVEFVDGQTFTYTYIQRGWSGHVLINSQKQ